MIDFKGHRFAKDILRLCVRGYLAYPLSYRNLEERRAERGVEVDHSNLYRWVQKFTPQREAAFRKGKKRPVGTSWRRDETYRYCFENTPFHPGGCAATHEHCWRTQIRGIFIPPVRVLSRFTETLLSHWSLFALVLGNPFPLVGVRQQYPYLKIKGQWRYLYRAVDRDGQTLDVLLTAHRDKKAARRFFKKAVRQHGLPDKVTLDQSGANTAAIEALREETGQAIEIRQNKSVNHLVEQAHRAVKRLVRPRLGFKAFHSAKATLPGIELMHMIKKGQMVIAGGQKRSAAGQFYSWAA